jgi:hypothetical protein
VPDDSTLLLLCFTFFGQSDVRGLHVTSEGTAAEIKKHNKITNRKKRTGAHQHNTNSRKSYQQNIKKCRKPHKHNIKKCRKIQKQYKKRAQISSPTYLT